MHFESFIDKDITVHTEGHKYRGILVEVSPTTTQGMSGPKLLTFKQGVDDFYIDASKVIAITHHGREMD